MCSRPQANPGLARLEIAVLSHCSLTVLRVRSCFQNMAPNHRVAAILAWPQALMKEEIKPLLAYPFIYLVTSVFPTIHRLVSFRPWQNAAVRTQVIFLNLSTTNVARGKTSQHSFGNMITSAMLPPQWIVSSFCRPLRRLPQTGPPDLILINPFLM